MSLGKKVVLHNKATSPSDGEIFFIKQSELFSTLALHISGDATSKTLVFEASAWNGIDMEDVWVPIAMYNMTTHKLETETNAADNQIYTCDVTSLKAFRCRLTAVSGGEVLVTASATGNN